jgi:hypothetical protein
MPILIRNELRYPQKVFVALYGKVAPPVNRLDTGIREWYDRTILEWFLYNDE